MSFNVSADAYLRFMGRYSEPLAARFADLAGVHGGQRVLDVGCGPGALTVRVRQAGFESWWETYTLGVGPAGAYLTSLPAARRDELRERCRRLVPAGPFDVSATAWAATATP